MARPVTAAVRTIMKRCLLVVSACASLMTSGVEPYVISLVYHLYLFAERLFKSFTCFFVFVFIVGLVVFLKLSFWGSRCIPEAGPLSDGGSADIFFQLVAFSSLNDVVQRPGAYIWMKVRLANFLS